VEQAERGAPVQERRGPPQLVQELPVPEQLVPQPPEVQPRVQLQRGVLVHQEPVELVELVGSSSAVLPPGQPPAMEHQD